MRYFPTYILIATYILGVFLFLTSAARAAPVSVETAVSERILGNPDAPVTIIEYASLTCSHCADFHKQTLPEIKRKYIDTGKARLIVRDFPFDALSMRAAMIARCAEPSRYFKFMDALFVNQSRWVLTDEQSSLQALASLAKIGGMRENDFNACITSEPILDAILKHRLEAVEKYDIQATPTFIIHDDKIEGNMPIDFFDDVIEKYLDD